LISALKALSPTISKSQWGSICKLNDLPEPTNCGVTRSNARVLRCRGGIFALTCVLISPVRGTRLSFLGRIPPLVGSTNTSKRPLQCFKSFTGACTSHDPAANVHGHHIALPHPSPLKACDAPMTTEPPFQIGPGIRAGLGTGLWYGLNVPCSDGEELHRPPIPPFRECSDVNYRMKLGTAWAKKEGFAEVSSKFDICSISYSPTFLASCVKLQRLVRKAQANAQEPTGECRDLHAWLILIWGVTSMLIWKMLIPRYRWQLLSQCSPKRLCDVRKRQVQQQHDHLQVPFWPSEWKAL